MSAGTAPLGQNGSGTTSSRPATPANGKPIRTSTEGGRCRPTHNAAFPLADGLPGCEPDLPRYLADGLPGCEPDIEDGDLPRYINASDDEELPRFVRQAGTGASRVGSRAGSRCSTPAMGRRCQTPTDGNSRVDSSSSMPRAQTSSAQSQAATLPMGLAHGLAKVPVAGPSSDFAASMSSSNGNLRSRQLMEARELVLPTRRCTREQQQAAGMQQANSRPQRACLAECGRSLVGR